MDQQNKASRRQFLKVVGGVIGASVVACVGVAFWGTRQPGIQFAESSCGEETSANARVLVAYASKYGSTGEVAETIGQVLCQSGASVDVRRVQEVEDITPYRAVILGTAILMGQPLSEAVDFVKKHQTALAQLPIACFSLGLSMQEDTPENREKAKDSLTPLLQEINPPVGLGLFGGKVDYSKLSPLYRLFLSMGKSDSTQEGDWRNWDAIRAWATDINREMGL